MPYSLGTNRAYAAGSARVLQVPAAGFVEVSVPSSHTQETQINLKHRQEFRKIACVLRALKSAATSSRTSALRRSQSIARLGRRLGRLAADEDAGPEFDEVQGAFSCRLRSSIILLRAHASILRLHLAMPRARCRSHSSACHVTMEAVDNTA